MDDHENKLGAAGDARKAYEAPKLESLGSLESHTRSSSNAGGRADFGSS